VVSKETFLEPPFQGSTLFEFPYSICGNSSNPLCTNVSPQPRIRLINREPTPENITWYDYRKKYQGWNNGVTNIYKIGLHDDIVIECMINPNDWPSIWKTETKNRQAIQMFSSVFHSLARLPKVMLKWIKFIVINGPGAGSSAGVINHNSLILNTDVMDEFLKLGIFEEFFVEKAVQEMAFANWNGNRSNIFSKEWTLGWEEASRLDKNFISRVATVV